MTRTFPFATAMVAAGLLAACGGTSFEDGSGGTGGGSNGGGITGSFDLVFKDVKQGESHGLSAPPASEGATARVDLRRSGSGYQALVTARWGEPAVMTATVTSGSVTLEGSVGGFSEGNASDTWTKLVLPRKNGTLSGAIRAEGTEDVFMGDVGDSYPITSGGTVGPDETAPELRASAPSPHGPDDAILPWDVLRLQAAEGVDERALANHIHVSASEGSGEPRLAWSFTPAAPDDRAWGGSIGATGRFLDWPSALRGVRLDVDEGVPDLAGRTSPAVSFPQRILYIGDPQIGVYYGTDATDYGQWGKVTLRSPGDSVCEAGSSCAQLGPFTNTVCGAEPAGVAARLVARDGTLVVRYRVLVAAAQYGAPDAPPDWMDTPFSVDLVTPGGEPTPTRAPHANPVFVTLPTPVGELRWATEWSELEIPVTSNSKAELGYAIFAGASKGGCGGMGGPVPPPSTMAVLVASVVIR